MIAATVLPKSYVWSLTAFTVACYSLLLEFYLPLNPADHMHHDSGFTQHVFGMWFGFVFSAGLIATFVTNMASTLRERDRVLAQAREQALRDERLVALGTLAAGAAHELGTPLGTMAIVTDELIQDYPTEKDPALHDSLQLVRGQIDRCKDALSVISASAGELRADSGTALPVDDYLEQLIRQWRSERPDIAFHYQLEGETPVPQIMADRALGQALTNILNNAADASPHWVELSAQWTSQQLILEVNDQGSGLSEGASRKVGKTPYSTKEHGLGLGLFLAHSVIGRLGGEVMLFNRETSNNDVQGGLCTRITLPLTGRAA
jgi:two-component system sensor histidine kinase RegB